jgi:hypothetical protein
MSGELNRETAREIANGIAIHREAQDCVAERIFTALQIAQKRGEILAARAPREIPQATKGRLVRYQMELETCMIGTRIQIVNQIQATEQTLKECGYTI